VGDEQATRFERARERMAPIPKRRNRTSELSDVEYAVVIAKQSSLRRP